MVSSSNDATPMDVDDEPAASTTAETPAATPPGSPLTDLDTAFAESEEYRTRGMLSFTTAYVNH